MFALALLLSVGYETPDPPPVTPDPPPVRVVDGVFSEPTNPRVDPSGYYELREWYDGLKWHSRWVPRREVSRPATPFLSGSGVITIRTTGVTSAALSSTEFPASTGTVRTITLVPAAVILGVTNCPSGLP